MIHVIFNILVILMSFIIFAMKVTGLPWLSNAIASLILKGGSLFCMLYAGLQIFKHFNII